MICKKLPIWILELFLKQFTVISIIIADESFFQTEFEIKHTMKISLTFLPSLFIGFSSCLSCCKTKSYEMK